MASDTPTTKVAHKGTHRHAKRAFDPSDLRYRKLTLLTLWKLTETGGLLEPNYSFLNRGQGIHSAIRLI